MISLTKLVIILVIAVILLILILSGKARTLVKAFFNMFVEDLAATPEGAEALFRQKEEETAEKFRRADAAFKKIAGKRKRCSDDLATLKKRLVDIEKACEAFAKADDDENLDIKCQERAEVVEDIEMHENMLVKLNAAYKDAMDAKAACEEALREVQRQRKNVVNQMKQDRDMADIYADLEGIGVNNDTTKLLDRVMERSEELSDMATGSKESYDTRTSTRVKRANQKASTLKAQDYKAQLKSKYSK